MKKNNVYFSHEFHINRIAKINKRKATYFLPLLEVFLLLQLLTSFTRTS